MLFRSPHTKGNIPGAKKNDVFKKNVLYNIVYCKMQYVIVLYCEKVGNYLLNYYFKYWIILLTVRAVVGGSIPRLSALFYCYNYAIIIGLQTVMQ